MLFSSIALTFSGFTQNIRSYYGLNSSSLSQLRTKIEQRNQRESTQQAIARSYQIFAKQHPFWSNSLFDEHFLATTASPLLDKLHTEGKFPSGYELAVAWCRQFEESQQDVAHSRLAEIIPVAEEFLSILRSELNS